MTLTPADTSDLFQQILHQGSRPNPYPLYDRLHEQPVARLADGGYLISSYADITQLLHDPRISADRRTEDSAKGRTMPVGTDGKPAPRAFLTQDPPVHDRLRRQVMHGLVPRIMGLRPHIETLVGRLLDAHTTDVPGQFDVVTDLAYPLPVTIICELLGVPREDEPVFGEFARKLTRGLDPVQSLSEDELNELTTTRTELRAYLIELIRQRKDRPGDDLLSALLAGDGVESPMGQQDLIANVGLLLIAGHETTVNLIANGTLAMLRHPEVRGQLGRDPELATTLVEEVLRYDPPVQMSGRRTLADITLDGTTIPAHTRVTLMIAAGNRDPRRFEEPDEFRPQRQNNAHISFGGGIHYCVGAAVARTEAQVAFAALARRLDRPRLVADPPPYRDNAILRGPENLPVAFDRLTS